MRLTLDNFSLWWKSKGVYTISFDGASKGNPGVVGDSGLVFSPDNEKIASFCWGLRICSNNQAECYSLLRACHLAKSIGLKEIQIFEDSEVLIKLLNSDSVAAATFSPTSVFHLNSGTPPYLDLLESKVEILASLSIFALKLSVRLVGWLRSVQCESRDRF